MIDRNDPRLTAYALGEMDATERAEFEQALAKDPAARAEIEAIQALGGKLRTEFAKSPAPTLTEAQRASVAKAARRHVPATILVGFAAAASVMLAVTVYYATRGDSASFSMDSCEYEARVQESASRRRAVGFQGPNGAVAPEARELEAGEKVEDARVKAPAPGLQLHPPSDPSYVGDPTPQFREHFDAVEEALATPPTSPAPGPTINTAIGLGAGGPAPGAVEAPAKGPAGRPAGAHKRLDGEFSKRLNEALRPEHNTEAYDRIRENPFVRVAEEDSSTFSIDVDTASYANVRRFLSQQHQLPPPDAVRVEEMINYFAYGYEPPAAGSPHPFRIHVEVAACPWDATHRLARVAIKGKVIDHRERPSSNLVFLVDVSGSMDHPAKLPLVQASLRMLAENLGEHDRVAIAVYASSSGLVLPSTGDKRQVIEAIERLRAAGSTNGGQGIQLAYQVATENFVKGGTNRVILCTDGDFNVGVTDDGSLTRLIEEKAKSGVFLSVLGFGTGNLKDGKMQQLADKGNGNHAYIDSILEARKVLGEEMSGTLVTIAKDVKIQLFFNSKRVAGFRLIGYENRLLAKQDFNDDTKDAGEIGAGHCVTALYEIVPAGSEVPGPPAVDRNPFVAKAEATVEADALFQLRLRYKQPDGDKSELLEQMVRDGSGTFDAASPDFRWASAVAAFGMTLRGTAGMGLDAVAEIAKGAAGDDKYRREFLQLVETAKLLKR